MTARDGRYQVWECKLVIPAGVALPSGADRPFRHAVAFALEGLGIPHVATFSGWGGSLTESEIAVVEDRSPVVPPGYRRIPVEAYTDGHRLVVLGSPYDVHDDSGEDESWHSCDEMGCGSVGPHVLASVVVRPPEVAP